MDLMHDVWPQIAGSVWAIRVLGRGLVLIGLPLALAGLMLFTVTKRRGINWPSWCFWIFQIGFVVQVSSVAMTLMLSFILRPLAPPPLPSGTAWESLLPLIFVGSAVGGVFGVIAWRRLMAAVCPEAPPSILR
jgi:hypothetical protein